MPEAKLKIIDSYNKSKKKLNQQIKGLDSVLAELVDKQLHSLDIVHNLKRKKSKVA